jgi:hypothetical protein
MKYARLEYMDAARTIIAGHIDENHSVVIEPGHPHWDEAVRLTTEIFTETSPNRPPVPDLTFAQLLIGLVGEGIITRAEGEAWLAGKLPAGIRALIDTLPDAAQFPAIARAQRPSVVQRLDDLVVALAQSRGMDDAALDAFFTAYASA